MSVVVLPAVFLVGDDMGQIAEFKGAEQVIPVHGCGVEQLAGGGGPGHLHAVEEMPQLVCH